MADTTPHPTPKELQDIQAWKEALDHGDEQRMFALSQDPQSAAAVPFAWVNEAAKDGKLRAVELLMEAGAPLDPPYRTSQQIFQDELRGDPSPNNLLMTLLSHGRTAAPIVRHLLNHSRFNAKTTTPADTPSGRTLLFDLISKLGGLSHGIDLPLLREVIRNVIQLGAPVTGWNPVTLSNSYFLQPLWQVPLQDIDILELMVQKGASLEGPFARQQQGAEPEVTPFIFRVRELTRPQDVRAFLEFTNRHSAMAGSQAFSKGFSVTTLYAMSCNKPRAEDLSAVFGIFEEFGWSALDVDKNGKSVLDIVTERILDKGETRSDFTTAAALDGFVQWLLESKGLTTWSRLTPGGQASIERFAAPATEAEKEKIRVYAPLTSAFLQEQSLQASLPFFEKPTGGPKPRL